jgi:hypothetical protein
VSDTETPSWIAALERARTELEIALSVDAPWQAPRGAAGDADWAGYETALAGNPVYRCWAQLNEAIEHLRRQAQAQARSQAEAPAGRRRVSLRDVLDHIRNDPVLLESAETGPAAAGTPWIEVAPAARSDPERPGSAPLAETVRAPPEPEEATVSFVIREPARRAPAAGIGGGASTPRQPTVSAAPPRVPEPEPDPGTEAEVVIVLRRR